MSRRYPTIGDYGLIGDGRTAALVSRQGSIDWCCLPRFDSASVFGRLLDWDRGGHFQIHPTDQTTRSFRRYLDDSLVLVTVFETDDGEVWLHDCFITGTGTGATPGLGGPGGPVRSPGPELVRVVEGRRGTIELHALLAARLDYGGVAPWLRHRSDHLFSATGGNDALLIASDAPLAIADQHDLRATFEVRAGIRVRFSLTWAPPEEVDTTPDPGSPLTGLDDRLDATTTWWRAWIDAATADTAGPSRRSALVLKALTYAPTGAVVAAVTTSLPETPGGNRNWDYRYSWIRDSQFTVQALGEVGIDDEADGFRRFVERSAAGSAHSLQIMYGIGGERRLTEIELPELEGYRGARPVRVGNAASSQVQLDVYGYLLDLAWRWHGRGQSPDDDYWRFLLSLVDAAAERWQEPDRGIWEVRGDPEHFVHSKVMCWAALDRGLRLAEACLRQAPTRRWTRVRREMAEAIHTRGYDPDRGVFVRAFDRHDLDAALLLLPTVEFVAYDDPRLVRTADAIRSDLDDGGLLRRYRSDDGLGGDEGVFVACTFWLAECLARQGRLSEAQAAYDRAAATANDLGLFAEEYQADTGELVGNFPQGLSHLSHLTAALALRHQGGLVVPPPSDAHPR